MTYSCSDFTDTILDALGIDVPVEHRDNPAAQAELAVTVIRDLMAIKNLQLEQLAPILQAAIGGMEKLSLAEAKALEALCDQELGQKEADRIECWKDLESAAYKITELLTTIALLHAVAASETTH